MKKIKLTLTHEGNVFCTDIFESDTKRERELIDRAYSGRTQYLEIDTLQGVSFFGKKVLENSIISIIDCSEEGAL